MRKRKVSLRLHDGTADADSGADRKGYNSGHCLYSYGKIVCNCEDDKEKQEKASRAIVEKAGIQ